MSNVTRVGKRSALAEFVDQWQAESDRLADIVQKVRDAADHGVGAMPTDEALAAALVLKRVDWLSEHDCTGAGQNQTRLGRADSSGYQGHRG
jgi:hypothetical protein